MVLQSKTQRRILLSMVVTIVLCAVMGIHSVLSSFRGVYNPVSECVLLTSLAIAGTIILLFMNWIVITKQDRGFLITFIVPILSITLLVSLLYIWAENYIYSNLGYHYLENTENLLWNIAISMTLANLLSMEKLKRHWQLIKHLTIALVILESILFAMTTSPFFDRETLGELLLVFIFLAIITLCGIITIPILHRLSIIPSVKGLITVSLDISMTCPRCGKTQTLPAGRSKCADCGLRFNIEIQEEHCRKCGYPLYQLQSAVCPECGTPIARSVGST